MAPTTSTTRELILDLEDRPGELGKLAQILGKESINILGYAALAHEGRASLHLITDAEDDAETVLQQSGYNPRTRPAMVIGVDNAPGELGRIAATLGRAGINISASFAAATPKGNDLRIVLSVDDVDGAIKALEGL